MQTTTAASWTSKLLARALTSEGLLGVAGCAMAVASGSFALYMNLNGSTGDPDTGSHYFTVFAQLGPQGRAIRSTGINTFTSRGTAAGEIDPVVTGSIPARPETTGPADVRSGTAAAASKPILSNVLLRQVEGDNALVEMNDRLAVYKVGDMIPGAGRIVAMTHQGSLPAIETSIGLIVETP